MEIPKKYFHDRVVLLLITINVFVVFLLSTLILLRLDSDSSSSYIVQYRSNLGLSGYQAGGTSEFFAFIAFGILVVVSHVILSMRIYDVKRQYALTILALSTLLVVLGLVVSNALLALR